MLEHLEFSHPENRFLFVYPRRRLEEQFFQPGDWPVIPISLRRCWLFFHPGRDLEKALSPRTPDPGLSLLKQIVIALGQSGSPLFDSMSLFLESMDDCPEFKALNILMRHLDQFPLADPGLLYRPPVADPSVSIQSLTADQILPSLTKPRVPSDDDFSESLKVPPPGTVTSFLTADYLRTRLPGYSPRRQQCQYAESVIDCFRDHTHNYLEAPTGTGKTLGYLSAAAHFLERNPGHRICVATATLNLQEQIVSRDWPVLAERFPGIRIALLKGKRNFLCLSALRRQFASIFHKTDIPDPSWDTRAAWVYLAIVAWRSHGDIETLPQDIRRWLPMLEDLLQDTRADANCVPGLCQLKACFHAVHVNRALRARLVVLNHFMIPYLPDAVLDNCAAMIIDEADRFPDNLRKALTVEIHSREMQRLLFRLDGGAKRQGFIQLIEPMLAAKGQNTDELRGLLKKIQEGLSRIQSNLMEAGRSPGGLIHTLPSFRGAGFLTLTQTLSGAFTEIANRFESLGSDDDSPLSEPFKSRCLEYASLFGATADRFHDLYAGFGTREFAHSYHLKNFDWSLNKTPIYIQNHLRQGLFSAVPSVIFTSATLAIRQRFDFITRQLDLGTAPATRKEIIFPTPFSWNEVSACFVDTSLPPYRYHDPDQMADYRRAVVRAIVEYAAAFKGRSLVLLMSHEEMNHVYEKTASQLEKQNIRVLKQNGSSVEEIRTFRAVPNSVLLGVDRFWSGVDFPGETLSLVIIAKAPNPSLNDPLIAHRKKWEPGFMHEVYPVFGALRLRQGFGRLIRSRNDRGGMVILDSRYANPSWYPDHLAALPVKPRFEAQRDIIISTLKRLLQPRKSA